MQVKQAERQHRRDTFFELLLLGVFVLAIVALFGFWPGQYQYHNTHDGILVRVNRYTGQAEYYLIGTGWKISTPPEPTPNLPPPGVVDPFVRPIPSPSVSR
jgi:hypothetical protein